MNIFSQTTPFVINKCISDNSFHAVNGLICSDELRMKWFMLLPMFDTVKEKPVFSGFSVVKSGIGTCSKNDLLVIMFTDHTRTILRSVNLNLECETWIEFNTNSYVTTMLQTKKIDAIRYVNGNELKSFVYYLNAEEKNYFIDAFSNYKIESVNCK